MPLSSATPHRARVRSFSSRPCFDCSPRNAVDLARRRYRFDSTAQRERERNEKLTQKETLHRVCSAKIWRARCNALCHQLLLLIRKRRHADERGRGGGGRSRKPVACRTLALNKYNKKEDRGSKTVSFCDLCFFTVF